MVKFEYYNPGECNCVVRSLSKITGKDINKVEDELIKINENYAEVEVFEEYMKLNNINKINYDKDMCIRELDFSNNEYIVFCYDKNDFYHMVCIIDNVLYDKKDDTLGLYPISIYMKER